MPEKTLDISLKKIAIVLNTLAIFMSIGCLILITIVWDIESALLASSAICILLTMILPNLWMDSYDIFQPLSFTLYWCYFKNILCTDKPK